MPFSQNRRELKLLKERPAGPPRAGRSGVQWPVGDIRLSSTRPPSKVGTWRLGTRKQVPRSSCPSRGMASPESPSPKHEDPPAPAQERRPHPQAPREHFPPPLQHRVSHVVPRAQELVPDVELHVLGWEGAQWAGRRGRITRRPKWFCSLVTCWPNHAHLAPT